MARRFIWELLTVNGLVKSGRKDFISLDDLPRVSDQVPGTGLGMLTVDANGRVTRTAFLPAGVTYYSITPNIDGSIIGTTTAPSTPVRVVSHITDVGSVGTTETDLITTTLTAGLLASNSQAIIGTYSGTFAGAGASTNRLRMSFGGTMFFDSDDLPVSAAAGWSVRFTVIRVSAAIVRCEAAMTVSDQVTKTEAVLNYVEITGLTLANTQVLKITGQSAGGGAADNDVVARMGVATWYPAS